MNDMSPSCFTQCPSVPSIPSVPPNDARDAMPIVMEGRSRRDFLRLGASSLLGAAAIAALPAPVRARRSERGRFTAIDETLAQAVGNGTVAGVVALAADSRGVIYERATGKR